MGKRIPKDMIKRERINLLIKQGRTPLEIAAIFGISKQRVHQLATGYVSPVNRPKV